MKRNSKSKSPIQQHSEYLGSITRKNRPRLSGRLRKIPCKDSHSHLNTECDSKAPSLSSTPITPVSQAKLTFTSPRQIAKERLGILRRKIRLLKDSITTTDNFYKQRVAQGREENALLHQELAMFGSRLVTTPTTKSNFLSLSRKWDRMGSGSKSGSKRLFALCSPSRSRQSRAKEGFNNLGPLRRTVSPREEYFSSRRHVKS